MSVLDTSKGLPVKVLLSVAILLAGCDWGKQAGPLIQTQTGRSLHNDPETEAGYALSSNNHRLLSVRGYTLEVPGTGLSIDEARKRFGVEEIEGTGDVYESRQQESFNERAYEYAKRYNVRIIKAQ